MIRLGGLEAGGTKFVCAVGNGATVQQRVSFPTRKPEETLAEALAFFKHHPVQALGIACFGPVDLNPSSPTFGRITATPKPHWQNTDIVQPFAQALGIPVHFDTDVNGAALGEWAWGAGRGLNDVLYLTVGTGIGGGALSGGRPIHGLIHPEMGHIRVPRDPSDCFAGCCPFHGDCLEGLASGAAIHQRWGRAGEKLEDSHPAWRLEARYLALGLVNLVMTLSPQRVILGGGVMRRPPLYTLIRQEFKMLVNDYLQANQLKDLESYIVAPALGENAGVVGAFVLAQQALEAATG
ncbi:MAG: ROK family protein [Bryobacteraceae bacterium]|nr:ROK family protein [Bryobacteraceae bacterium]MDW8376737.1 ROK family protein [Bryobacterales bacterium]